MACEQYTNGTNAQVTFTAGNLPTNFCPDTWQDAFNQFVLSLMGTLPGTYSTFVIQAAEPAAQDRDKVWIKLDATNCRPDGMWAYFNGEWIRMDAEVIYGEDTGTQDDITLTDLTPNVNYVTTSQLYIIRLAYSNSGPATLTLPFAGYAAVPIRKYGVEELTGFEMSAGMLALFAYDSANSRFQLLNPLPIIDLSDAGIIQNPSFEHDLDEDDIPDYWTLEIVDPVGAGATNPTYVVDDTESDHGGRSFKVTQVAGQNVRYLLLTTNGYYKIRPYEWLYLSFSMMAELGGEPAARPAYVNILWYDEDVGYLSTTVLWTHLMDGAVGSFPTANFGRFAGVCEAPVGARFFQIQLQVGDNTTVGKVAKAVWFDDFRIGVPQFQQSLTCVATKPADNLGGATAPIQYRNTFYSEATVYCVRVRAWGGGGGGSYQSATNYGGGGGGGEYVESFVNVSPSTNYALLIGGGGTSGSVGSKWGAPGAATTFNATVVVANGGSGADPVAVGGNGGTGGTGQVTVGGEDGGDGGVFAGNVVGYGGSSPFNGGRNVDESSGSFIDNDSLPPGTANGGHGERTLGNTEAGCGGKMIIESMQ